MLFLPINWRLNNRKVSLTSRLAKAVVAKGDIYLFGAELVGAGHEMGANEWKGYRVAQLGRILEAKVKVLEEQVGIEAVGQRVEWT